MSKDRLEAFSDGVIAILITIMVLELGAPHGTSWAALRADLPGLLLAYVQFIPLPFRPRHRLRARHALRAG